MKNATEGDIFAHRGRDNLCSVEWYIVCGCGHRICTLQCTSVQIKGQDLNNKYCRILY